MEAVAAEAAAAAVAAAAVVAVGKEIQPSFCDAMESVRGDTEPFNWLLAEI